MCRRLAILIPLLAAIWSHAQSASLAIEPEDGFLSSQQYTNAFFGFALSLPRLANAQQFMPQMMNAGHTLFGLQSYRRGLSLFLITADGSQGGSEEDVKKAAGGSGGQPLKQVTIGGRAFWKNEAEEKSSAGKLRITTYTTGLKGYVLTFKIAAFDGKVARELEEGVESLKFFDPANARDVAGTASRPFGVHPELPSAAFVPSKRIGTLGLGTVTNSLYTNDDLGFSYEVPNDWQIADKATQDKVMEAGHQALWANDPAARVEHGLAAECGRVLLYATKYLAGSVRGTENPAVTIIAVDPACSPGAPAFPTSVDDNDGISRVGGALMHSLQSEGFRPKKQGRVRVLSAQNHLMIEIPGEYSVQVPGERLAIRGEASVVFMELKGYWVGISFISPTEAGVRHLMNEAKVNFVRPVASSAVKR